MRTLRTILALCLLPGSIAGLAQTASPSNAAAAAPPANLAGIAAPQDARAVTYRDLVEGVRDGEPVEVQGVIHAVTLPKFGGPNIVTLKLVMDGGPVDVLLQSSTGTDPHTLVDATVQVRGVYSTALRGIRQTGVGMIVTDATGLQVQKAAPADAFSLPTISVHDVVQFGRTWRAGHRVKVRGTVVYQGPAHVLYLQDGNDGIEVQTSSSDHIATGRTVEAVGFPIVGDYAPVLQEAWVRVIGTGVPIKPLTVDAADVVASRSGPAQAPHEQLASIQGEVVESYTQDHERVWILRQSEKVFEAHLALAAGDIEKKDTVVGSTLLLNGICRVHADANGNPISFDFLLRSPQDIQLLHRPPWWTVRDTLALLALLIGITVVIGLLDIVQTRNIREQTRIIRESEQKFRDMAECDALTGLPNRLTLEERIAECLTTCDREEVKAAILTVDIDRFKQINDTFGHLVGDECLKAVAERLKSKVRAGDTIARTGGEEFTLIIGRLSSRENAKKVCSALLNLFKDPLTLPDRELSLTVSIGVAMYPDDGTDSKTLRKRSDQALYEAKRTGRNRAVFATQELSESSELSSLVETKLREDLRFNRFHLYFQPICDADKNICRFEALLRSPNMHLSKIGPGQFVPIAEECGLIVPIGRWVIREVCRQMAEWRAQGMKICPVAVNVSGRQLLRREFVSEVLQDIRRYNIQPEMLELELTETTIMHKLGPAAETIGELAQAGLTFAIDDFGTGYSSLSRLNQLPIKALKIDASFVKELELESGSYTIVRAVMQMAKSLGLNVVAEGIEHGEQFDILSTLGCDFFQGYLIGKPLPAEEAIACIEDNQVVLVQNQITPHWSSHLTPRIFS